MLARAFLLLIILPWTALAGDKPKTTPKPTRCVGWQKSPLCKTCEYCAYCGKKGKWGKRPDNSGTCPRCEKR